MHPSALNYGKLFFNTYCCELSNVTVVDIGAQNVNGSLKDVCPKSIKYVGVDFVVGNGVDIVLDDPYKLPFENDSLDIVVCSSCFEHSQFFWLLFLEIVRSLKSDGLLYLNVPSNGSFHRYPVDCWRFYPDSGHALVAWANREGYPLALLESFIGDQSQSNIKDGAAWHDFVAIFVKSANIEHKYKNRIVDILNNYSNGYSSIHGYTLNEVDLSPDHLKNVELVQALEERDDQIANLNRAIAEREEKIFIGTYQPISETQALQVQIEQQKIISSIIIPVFNQVAYTKQCLEMLYTNTPENLSFEVIIVDNASSDDTAEFLNVATQMYRNLRVIHNNENLLFAKACNHGAQAAQGEFLVFLNNDTEPLPGWLDQGLARLKSDPAIGVVGSKLLYPDGTIQHCGIEFLARTDLAPPYNIWPEHRFRGVTADDPRVNVSEEISIVTGACLFISKKLFQVVGGFSPDYGMYFEDIDLCMKVRKQGKTIWYEPLSVLIHHEAKSSLPSRKYLDSLTLSASVIFYKRWLPEIMELANRLDSNSSSLFQKTAQDLSFEKTVPIKVLYDISVLGLGELYESARTGIYRVVEHVVQGLAASSEIRLAFCATQAITEQSPETIAGCQQYLAGHREFQHIPFFTSGFPTVDIFHSPFHVLPNWIDAPVRFLTVYDLIPIMFPQFIPPHVTKLQQITFSQTKSRDRFICISHATKKDLCQIVGIAPDRATVNHLAADSVIFYPCVDEQILTKIRSKYGIGSVPYILSLCTLEPRKNIDHVIRAFACLVRDGQAGDARLVLTGTKGWDFNRIFSEIDDNPELHSRIVLTGYVPDEELAALYSGATVFVYMSLYEGFGLPPLEAMQCGVPVITSNTSSLPEVVGGAGIMLDPQDLEGLCRALQEVITNPELHTEMSNRSLVQAANFSWDRCVEETICAYQLSLKMTEKISITGDSKKAPIKLYFYRPEIDFSLVDRVCCDLVPLLLGTRLEQMYEVRTNPEQWRFHPVSHDWRNNPMWDGYAYDSDLFEITDSPDEADYFVFPYMLDEMIEGAWEESLGLWLRNLPYYKHAPDRHIFMSFHDSSEPFGMDALFFRASVKTSRKDPNAFALPYPVENFQSSLHFEPARIKYDVSFVGCISDSKSRPLRRQAVESLQNTALLRTFVSTSEYFHGLEEAQVRAERRELFLTSLSESWLVICPRGTGENSYRFFETLSMGRIPVLLADDCTLPFEGRIDYSKFILRIPETEAVRSVEIIASWLSSQTAESLVERCRLARRVWEQYFACPQWNRRIVEILTSRVRQNPIVIDGVIFQLQHGRPFGISRLWLTLLTELVDTPLAQRIVLLDRAGTAPQIPGIKVRQIDAFRLGTAFDEAVNLNRICRELQAGLFISTYYTCTTATPSLLMLYDMIPERFDTVGPAAPNPEWRDKYHAIVNSSAFAAISDSTARDLATFYPQAAQRPLTVIPCAVSEDFREHSAEEIAAFKTSSGIDRPYFLLVGRRDRHKNAALFFQAFARLPDRERYAIVMAGGGNTLEPEWKELAGPAAAYAGFFSDQDLSLAYSGALALVYPSLYEGFGLPILEAMQSGCPVITCQNSSLPEVAGSAALYVGENDVDGLAKTLLDVQQPEVRAYLVRRGLERARLFSWRKSAELLADCIRETVVASGAMNVAGGK